MQLKIKTADYLESIPFDGESVTKISLGLLLSQVASRLKCGEPVVVWIDLSYPHNHKLRLTVDPLLPDPKP